MKKEKVKGYILVVMGIIVCFTITSIVDNPTENSLVGSVSLGSIYVNICGSGFIVLGVISMVIGAYLIKKEDITNRYYY